MSVTLVLTLLFWRHAAGITDGSIVYPTMLEARQEGGRKFIRLTDEQTLSLEKASVFAKMIALNSDENGNYVEKYIDGSKIEENLYSDPHKMASLMLDDADGVIKLTGMISLTQRIEPVLGEPRSDHGAVPHRVSRIRMRDPFRNSAVRMRRDVSAEVHARIEPRNDLPDTVYLEVFVISDTYHNRFFNTTHQLINYLAIMFNSVNLRYETVEDPKIRLILVGVEASQSEPYIQNMRTKFTLEGSLHDDAVLDALEKYAHDGSIATYFDTLYLMTGRDIFAVGLFDESIEKRAAGIANLGGLCTKENVAAGEDIPGSFDGTFTVTHELAHLLGAVHDGSGPSLRIRGHQGSQRCPWNEGYIMSYKDTGENHFKFSECSKEQFRVLFRQTNQSCFDVVSKQVFNNLKLGFAGFYTKASTYCTLAFPEKPGIYPAERGNSLAECRLLCCRGDPNPDECYKKPLLDAMPCDDGKRCFNGVCIPFKG
ncbi:venom metalloproteinase antarease TserMP_A-like [Ornithodoros turicata]|uniref:venom metalloproteinase antarease TserMP_A-like n=1 Tax=Ornithodoros turicata TaxID=34597 RepID=UPI003139CD82